jgi:DNA polymerase III subunit epsilon
MNWLKHLLSRKKPALTPEQSERLAAWQALPEADQRTPFEHSRFVVVDVETTGLNLMRDSLISIGAVSVVNKHIIMGDSFSVVLQQHKSSHKDNILIHGISGSEQRAGDDPVEALLSFLEYLGKSPLVAFHVAFDESMIQHAMHKYLGFSFKHRWLDLAYVLPSLNSRLRHSHRSLDDWSNYFSIRNDERHNAVADALATAHLLLIVMAQVRNVSNPSYDTLRYIERTFHHTKMGT